MTDKLDMALDDVVKTMKKPRRGGFRGRGRGRGGRGRGGRSTSRGGRGGGQVRGGGRGRARGFGLSTRGGRQSLQTSGTPKLLISNLHPGVSDYDIHELFAEFGTMKTATIHYDRNGRSLGTAQVTFVRKDDAVKANRQYNGVHLDGRPMHISMEGGAGIGFAQKGSVVKRLSGVPRGVPRGTGRGRARGRGGRGGRGGKGGATKSKPKTAEQLDAELDAYLKTKPTTAKDLDAELDSYVKEAPKA